MEKIKFTSTGAFTQALKQRVNEFFKKNNISKKGNFNLHLKSTILLVSFVISYIGAFYLPPFTLLRIISTIILGFSVVGIGFNIMHDGAHGSYSTKSWINTLAGHSMNLIGATVSLWKPKHNILHHTFTNIAGHDDDIELYPLVRTLPHQKKLLLHRVQNWYFWALYPFHLFLWIYGSDFQQYFKQRVATQKVPFSTREHFIFWITKITHIGLFLVLPICTVGIIATLVSYIVTMMIASIILSFVFQCAHLVTETTMRDVGDEHTKEWTVHQLETTADFGQKSKMLTWFLGGLNFQVEHHLFHDISHVHYPKISRIVKETCAEFKIPYHEYPTFLGALKSHFSYMKKMAIT